MRNIEEIAKDLQWRYATKKFDPSKDVSQTNLDAIINAIQMSPTSYGLQPFEVRIIKDTSIRKALRPVSWDQTQITDSSVLMVFCRIDSTGPKEVSAHLDRRAAAYGQPRESQAGAEAFMNSKLAEIPADKMKTWAEKQSYIALGFAMMCCAELRVDACPIEGFDPLEYDRILDLSKDGVTASCVLAIGYRNEEDSYADLPKFRKPLTELVKVV